jgi:hypothetical protein
MTAKQKRTATLIEKYKNLPGEYYMLKGLLCMSHTNDRVLSDVLDGIMIAVRMDELNASCIK